MSGRLTRRIVLGGLLSSAAAPVLAEAPLTSIRPMPRGNRVPPTIPGANALIEKAGLGGRVCFTVADAKTGEMLERHGALYPMPPASVAKVTTALYALDTLGPDYRFATRLLATGPVEAGRIKGDLILAGGGDPTLDTDALGGLAAALKDKGIHGVDGAFRVWAGALPAQPWIEGTQPDHVGYNPAISGLNLNFNRVHFEWKRAGDRYDITMEARAERFSPAVDVARMRVSSDQAAVYTYAHADGVDRWAVAQRALGDGGSRWLPVRRPEAYATEVFATVARSYGIALKQGVPLQDLPEGTELARHESDDLQSLMRGMLRFSTNLTAEVAGLSASVAAGGAPRDLRASAEAMNIWAKERLGVAGLDFVDHSGLGYASEVSSDEMVQVLLGAGQVSELRDILRQFKVNAPEGKLMDVSAIDVRAKTGSLNFVSALAGFITGANGRELAFAIFTGDEARRDAIPVSERERPEGARGWQRRSRRLQQDLLLRWVEVFEG